jgi:hypothetical protein
MNYRTDDYSGKSARRLSENKTREQAATDWVWRNLKNIRVQI